MKEVTDKLHVIKIKNFCSWLHVLVPAPHVPHAPPPPRPAPYNQVRCKEERSPGEGGVSETSTGS